MNATPAVYEKLGLTMVHLPELAAQVSENVVGRTGGAVTAVKGPEGGAAVRGRGYTTDGAGNGTAASGGAFKTASGATGARASTTTRNADGSASHQGGFTATGAKGTVDSSGNVTKGADGSVNGSRTTTATGANGTTYNGSTTYSKDTGVQHTGTCTDAAGNTVACR